MLQGLVRPTSVWVGVEIRKRREPPTVNGAASALVVNRLTLEELGCPPNKLWAGQSCYLQGGPQQTGSESCREAHGGEEQRTC